jgi:ferrous iron transport protein A
MTHVATELSVGQSGRVARVSGSDDVTRRLLEMGVTPGVELRRLGAAPLGDPLEFELRGYRLSLRRSEAQHIELDVSENRKLNREGTKNTKTRNDEG